MAGVEVISYAILMMLGIFVVFSLMPEGN